MNPTRPSVADVMPIVQRIYEHTAGCCLHIVVDDGNIRDCDVASCLEQAKTRGHEDCIAGS